MKIVTGTLFVVAAIIATTIVASIAGYFYGSL